MGIFSELFGKRPAADHPAAPSREAGFDSEYADPADYDPLPVLTLTAWDYGHGLEEATAGYGFVVPDGKIWPAGKCQWSTWSELGVLVINVVGARYHFEDLADPSFDPGRPVRLHPEPENPHDPKAIAVRNWPGDRTAGYVKKGSTSRLRNMLRGHDLRVMALSCRYDQPPPRGRRQALKVVIFRPDRLVGAEHVPAHPPID